jgi:uncharacterized membrane protein
MKRRTVRMFLSSSRGSADRRANLARVLTETHLLHLVLLLIARRNRRPRALLFPALKLGPAMLVAPIDELSVGPVTHYSASPFLRGRRVA